MTRWAEIAVTIAGNIEDPLLLHKYLYAEDDPVDNVDPNGRQVDEVIGLIELALAFEALPNVGMLSGSGSTDPVIIGFYGADFSKDNNEGNQKMKALADSLHVPIFPARDTSHAEDYILKHATSPTARIKIFGHSWGGISAVQVADYIGLSPLQDHEVDVYTIDPVPTLRSGAKNVFGNVKFFWNRYQTHGNGVVIAGTPVHGTRLDSYAKKSDQVDLNPGPGDNGIDHWNIIDNVKTDLTAKLKDP